MVISLAHVVNEEGITGWGMTNIIVFTLVGILGIFMGLFFGLQFLFQANTKLVILNGVSLIVGLISIIFIYWYTGNIK